MSDYTARRDFLAQVAAAGLTVAGVAALPLPAHASPPFDDTWTRRVAAARHRAVFDGPDVADGLPLLQPWIWRRGYQEALGVPAAQAVPVVVLRHAAVSLALADAIWAKYELGALRKIDDPVTRKPAVRNPWGRRSPDAPVEPSLVAALGADVDPTVEGVLRSGGIVLACNLALGRVARGIAERSKGDAAAIHDELRGGVVPGVVVQPSGVYATARAQEVGCVFMRST